jgi:membrane-associated phospholipid phosphatase
MSPRKFLHQLIPFLSTKFFEAVTALGTTFFCGIVLLYIFRINFWLGLQSTITFFFTELISSLIKITFKTVRPKPRKNNGTLLDQYEAGSFPSLHSARITVLALTLYPLIKHDQILILITFSLIAIVSYSRIHLKQHYLVDVIAGLTIGAVTFSLVNQAFQLI